MNIGHVAIVACLVGLVTGCRPKDPFAGKLTEVRCPGLPVDTAHGGISGRYEPAGYSYADGRGREVIVGNLCVLRAIK